MARFEMDLQEAILSAEYSFRNYRGEYITAEIEGWGYFWAEEVTELDLPEFGHLEVVEVVGGEGQGDHAHIVFSLRDPDGDEVSFFKVDGYYSSYDGVDWDGSDLYSVTPEQRTITVYV